MTYRWAHKEYNFHLQGNLQGNHSFCCNENYNQKLYTKAYLNPQSINYELIKKSLIKSSLQSGGKIHINPNFKGKGLSNATNRNYPSLVNTVLLNSHKKLLRVQEHSQTLSEYKEKKNSETLINNENNFNSTSIPHQYCFKKVDAVNMRSFNNSQYSWFKSKTDKRNLNLYAKNTSATFVPRPVNEKSTVVNYNKNVYKCTFPKKSAAQSEQSSKNCLIYKSKTKIINESEALLMNNAFSKIKLHFKDKRIPTPIKRNLNLSKFVYNKNKKSSVLMVAKAVRSKYKYLNNLEQYKKSKYKIDKRNKVSETVKNKSNKIKDIRKLFPNYFYSKVKLSSYNVYNIDKEGIVSKSNCSWRKNQLSDKSIKKVMKQTLNKRVVNIGGILYKSTANKLTLANKESGCNSEKTIHKSKGEKKHVVYVRGEKFILENNGKALRRQSGNTVDEKTPLFTPKRIDIGGVTYLQRSNNVLIRTNVHQARHLVNKAKNKSIALLANLHKRSSMPCMIYHRFGRCIRHTKGLCIYTHDKKNIAVCKKFLKGNCTNNNCLLSHQAIQEKMATCHFFLKGLCVRENCPFLHVKLNKNAAICENFLQGFCHFGRECSKRHLHQCPEFDKYGTCKLGSKCHYPHKKSNKREKNLDKETKGTSCGNSGEPKNQNILGKNQKIKSGFQKKQKKGKSSILKLKEVINMKVQKKVIKKKGLLLNDSDQNNDAIECFPKRIKLDKLPCFIPLASTSGF